MHRNAVGIALLDRAETPTALHIGGELDLGSVARIKSGGRPGWPGYVAQCSPRRSASSGPRPASPPSAARWKRTVQRAVHHLGHHPTGPRVKPEGRPHHAGLRATIRSRIAAPLIRGADPRMIQATIPSRLLFSDCLHAPNRTRSASRKRFFGLRGMLRFASIKNGWLLGRDVRIE
jgi:hypothetical protein